MFNGALMALNTVIVNILAFAGYLEGVVITKLADVVTEEMISGVFDQILGLLPVLLPVSVTFIGFRKGLSFLFQTLRMA